MIPLSPMPFPTEGNWDSWLAIITLLVVILIAIFGLNSL